MDIATLLGSGYMRKRTICLINKTTIIVSKVALQWFIVHILSRTWLWHIPEQEVLQIRSLYKVSATIERAFIVTHNFHEHSNCQRAHVQTYFRTFLINAEGLRCTLTLAGYRTVQRCVLSSSPLTAKTLIADNDWCSSPALNSPHTCDSVKEVTIVISTFQTDKL